MSADRECQACKRRLPLLAYSPPRSFQCRSCVAGRQRFAALARTRPHLLQLGPQARAVLVAWETARLALTRALRRDGVHVTWRGFEPRVVVVPRPFPCSPDLGRAARICSQRSEA